MKKFVKKITMFCALLLFVSGMLNSTYALMAREKTITPVVVLGYFLIILGVVLIIKTVNWYVELTKNKELKDEKEKNKAITTLIVVMIAAIVSFIFGFYLFDVSNYYITIPF